MIESFKDNKDIKLQKLVSASEYTIKRASSISQFRLFIFFLELHDKLATVRIVDSQLQNCRLQKNVDWPNFNQKSEPDYLLAN